MENIWSSEDNSKYLTISSAFNFNFDSKSSHICVNTLGGLFCLDGADALELKEILSQELEKRKK